MGSAAHENIAWNRKPIKAMNRMTPQNLWVTTLSILSLQLGAPVGVHRTDPAQMERIQM
jgi:hypothetical protein